MNETDCVCPFNAPLISFIVFWREHTKHRRTATMNGTNGCERKNTFYKWNQWDFAFFVKRPHASRDMSIRSCSMSAQRPQQLRYIWAILCHLRIIDLPYEPPYKLLDDGNDVAQFLFETVAYVHMTRDTTDARSMELHTHNTICVLVFFVSFFVQIFYRCTHRVWRQSSSSHGV